jgi:general secretion pathway protein F
MGASAGGTGGQLRASTTTSSPALADFIILNEEIVALTKARLPLESHLEQLGAELRGSAGGLAERIGRRMEAGEPLPAAMDAECANLPAVYRATVVAGIESGQLTSALESLVATASRLQEMRRVTGVALLYPLIVTVIACNLFAFTLAAIVPNFEWLHLPYFGPVIALAKWPRVVEFIALGLPAVLVTGAALWWWLSGRIAGSGASLSNPLSWMPWSRGAYRAAHAATLADLLRLLVDRGVPLDRALRLAGDAVDDRRLQVASQLLADDVARGSAIRVPNVLADDPRLEPFPKLVRLALRHMDDRRLLSSGLKQAATIYRERATRSAEWYAEYLPVLLTILIGGSLTALFALLVFWPYASMLHELAQPNWK